MGLPLPAPVAALAWYNKAVIYRLLFEVAAQPLCTIASDPKHLGARIGATLVLHQHDQGRAQRKVDQNRQ